MSDRPNFQHQPVGEEPIEHPRLPGRISRAIGGTLHLATLGPLRNREAERQGEILIDGHTFNVAVLEALEDTNQDSETWYKLTALLERLESAEQIESLAEEARAILSGITNFWIWLMIQYLDDGEIVPEANSPYSWDDINDLDQILRGQERFDGSDEVILRQLQCLKDLWNLGPNKRSDKRSHLEQKLIKENPEATGCAHSFAIQCRIHHRDLKARYGMKSTLQTSLDRLFSGDYVDGRYELLPDRSGPGRRILYFLTPKGVAWLNQNRWRLQELPGSKSAGSRVPECTFEPID